jgi:phage terminase large subunit-like protein
VILRPPPPDVAEEDLLAGLELIHRDTHGRYSLSDQVALKAQATWGEVTGVARRLALTPAEVLTWNYEPRYHLRPAQQRPDAFFKAGGEPLFPFWRTWFLLGGRGAGKTHAGSAGVIEEARQDPNARILIVGPTWSEIRKTQLEGPSGILTLAPPWFYPEFKVSKKELHFPNGAIGFCVPAQSSGKFKGYNTSYAWLDEIVAWRKEPLEILKECRRVNRFPTRRMKEFGIPARFCITTTPAPTQLFKEILKDRRGLILARSTTLDNASNLDPEYLRMALRLMHTTEGKREYGGELFFALDANLYRKVDWNRSRVKSLEHLPPRPEKPGEWMPAKFARRHGGKITKPFDFLVVSVDPATGEKRTADLHGIVVEGYRWEPDELLHTYVLADLSIQAPEASAWASAAVKAYHAWREYAPPKRTWVFAEGNTGGTSLVKGAVKAVDGTVPVRVKRAGNGTGGKAERAAPVSMLAEASLVHMVGRHHKLEDQLSNFTGQEGGHGRDDRADAFAWPIFLYVVPRREMRGAAGAEGAAAEEEEDAEESEE